MALNIIRGIICIVFIIYVGYMIVSCGMAVTKQWIYERMCKAKVSQRVLDLSELMFPLWSDPPYMVLTDSVGSSPHWDVMGMRMVGVTASNNDGTIWRSTGPISKWSKVHRFTGRSFD